MLSSIGGGGEYVPPSTPRVPVPTLPTSAKPPPSDTAMRNGISPADGGASFGQKRKAEEPLSSTCPKIARRDPPASAFTHHKASTNNLTPKSSIVRPPINNLPPKATALRLPVNNPPPNNPIARPPVTTASMQHRGIIRPTNASPIPATITAKAPPKKGSYAEILARAKAAQTTSAHVGVIKHKPKETLSKKERLALQAEASGKSKTSSKTREVAVNGRRNTPDSKGSSPAPSAIPNRNRDNTLSKPKKPTEVGYKGTARPLPETSYKGTMSRSSTTMPTSRTKSTNDSTFPRSRSTSATRPISRGKSRYAADDNDVDDEDEDEDEDGEEPDEYESDLSDMEAGAFDVEEEEQISSKVARREDDEEARKELELKNRKDEMRRKLTAMAAAKRRR